MACRLLHISEMSANNLKSVNWVSKMKAYVSVNWVSKMKAYVVVSLGGDPGTNRRTSVEDGRGGNNPCWNDHVSFPIDAAALNNLYLVFEIKSKRALGDRVVGRVTVPLQELFDSVDAAERVVEYQVRRPSGDARGTLRFSYKFWDKIAPPAKTVGDLTAYPAHVGAITAHPPPPGFGMAMPAAHPAGYGCPPQPAYGYAPPPYGYAPPPYGHAPPPYWYPPPVVQAQPGMKRKNFGLGLGAAPVGWLLMHGMLSDASDNAEYDAGYGDADIDF